MLDVSDNKITAIPDCIGELKMLERLDAYKNEITSLSPRVPAPRPEPLSLSLARSLSLSHTHRHTDTQTHKHATTHTHTHTHTHTKLGTRGAEAGACFRHIDFCITQL